MVGRKILTIIAEVMLMEATTSLYHALAAIRSNNLSNMARMAERRFVCGAL
jgi:hypothetical protein